MKAILFAAGLGTRLQPFTLHHPKALAVVNGKTLLERNILYLQKHSIYDVIVNVHHFANQILETIEINKGWGSNISISDERDEVLETGGGLKKAAWYFENEPDFVIMNVDMLTDMSLSNAIQQHQHTNPIATLAVTNRISSRYFLFNNQNLLCGWRNTKTGEEKGPFTKTNFNSETPLKPLAFSGIHIVNTDIFKHIHQEGKFSIVDVYLEVCQHSPIQSFDHSDSLLIDVGKPESLLKAAEMFA